MIIMLKGDVDTRQVWIDGKLLDPKPSQEVLDYSPSFSWGYNGPGIAQLAIAILLKFTDERTAVENHKYFQWEILDELNAGDFEIDVNLNAWITRRETA
jgi:hypothetical protein